MTELIIEWLRAADDKQLRLIFIFVKRITGH